MVYEWRVKGVNKVDPQVAGEVCEELEKSVGLTSKTLLDASRPEDAPLHYEFEWNDEVAAEKYRERQAKTLITNLAVSTEDISPTKAFVTLRTKIGESSNFEPVVDVLKSDDKRKRLLEIAKHELQSFKNKYKTLKELAGVIREIDKL